VTGGLNSVRLSSRGLFIPWQIVRFVMLNVKMVEIIIKGHH